MSTIRVKLRQSSVDGKPGRIVYSISHFRRVAIFTTDYKLYSCEWDNAKQKVIFCPNALRNDALASISRNIQWDIERLKSIIEELSSSLGTFTVNDLIVSFQQQNENQWLLKYFSSVISRLKQLGHIGTAKNYTSTLNSISQFRNHQDIQLFAVTTQFVEEYQAWLTAKGVKSNSISFYMRIFRAVYIRAIQNGYTNDRHPFKTAYTKIEKTAKRAITFDEIKRIKELELSSNPILELARDIFMFLFYSRGMSFIDAVYLRKSDMKAGIISYRRHKTNQLISVSVNQYLLRIIGKYSSSDSPYILPILSNNIDNHRRKYESSLRTVNQNLKKIGKLANIGTNLSTYTARHSWATIAKFKGVPTSIIADALGHDSEKTTQIYLSTISSVEIDRANEIILEGL